VRRGLALIAATVFVANTRCTWVNDVDPCGARPREVRVAPTTDQFELVGNPRAAARLDDGRILVVYERTNLADTSEVRIVVLNAQTGGRVDMCEQSSDLLLSQGYARHASVTAANFDRLGKHIVAAVAWSEGEGSATRAKYQLIAADLCPHTPAGVLLAPNVLGPTDDVSLTWSPQDAGVVATFQNSRSIHRSVIRGEAPEAATPIADGQLVISSYQSAFASDGRGLAAWFASDSTSEFLSNRRRLRVLLLDRGAVARKAVATGAATPFELAIPTPYQAPDLVNSLSLAVRDDRYAVAWHGVTSTGARPAAWVAELDAADGRPHGGPWRVDPATGEGHGRPAAAYLPEDNLLVAWLSPGGAGTVARLYQSGGRPRFTGITCDESRFKVGVRAPNENRGTPSLLVAGPDVWIFHPGEPSDDQFGNAAMGWWLPYSELWPSGG